MKQKMNWSKNCLLAGLVVLGSLASTASGAVLYDNLPPIAPNQYSYGLTGQDLVAQRFTTGGNNATLLSVALFIERESGNGTPIVQIWSGSSTLPDGTLLGSLTLSGSMSSSLAPTTFTSSGLALANGADYWVVMQGVSESVFNWGFTDQNSGSGGGFKSGNATSNPNDAGAFWLDYSTSPFQMQVQADLSPVPEPSEWAAISFSLLSVVWVVKRRFTLARS